MTELLNIVRTFADANADGFGMAHTPIPGMSVVRAGSPSGLLHAMSCPLICLVQQGRKQVTTGPDTVAFGAGESLLITADIPTVAQITEASAQSPYLSLVVELDIALIVELMSEIENVAAPRTPAIAAETTDVEVADCAYRLMRLTERPQSVPLLHGSLMREFHYWLLAGRHGPTVRRLGWQDSHTQQIARATRILRTEFAQPMKIEQLADRVGMSISSFHQRFREQTSLSPLQFQKQLRLIEARRLMQAEGISASSAAFDVGYESVSQFTREYGRMFGLPPAKDRQMTKRLSVAA